MAEHIHDEWAVAFNTADGWYVSAYLRGTYRVIACVLRECEARRIAREHNAHPGLVTACKAALAEFKPILDEAMCDEVGERPKVKIERMLDAAIADAERKGET